MYVNLGKERVMINQSWIERYLDDARREAMTRFRPYVDWLKDRHPEEKVEAVIVETIVLSTVFAVNVAALLVHFADRIRNFGMELPLD
jgi:hypothetical protein